MIVAPVVGGVSRWASLFIEVSHMAIRVDSNAGSSQNALNPIAPKEVPTGAQVVKAKGGDTLWKMWSENKVSFR